MAFFDIGNRRKQQEGRRNAGVMGQGLGRGLQMLQQGQRPGGMGADYREKLARMREMQGQPVEPAQMPPVGLGGMAAAPQQQAEMMRRQAMQRQQQERMYGLDRAREVGGLAGGEGRAMAYDQPRMNPYTQRQRALAAMQQRAAQPRQRGNTSAGVFRKMMLERARKRQMRDQRMQRNRFNPLMNR